LAGFGLLVCTLLPPLAVPCAAVCNLSLGAVEVLVHLGQRIPGGHFWVAGPAGWWLAGWYGGLALLVAFPRLVPRLRWRLAALAAWSAVGFVVCFLGADRHALRCTFLSVGHGEAIVLELPSGQTLLYDVGRFSAPTSAAEAVSGYLWSRGIRRLDAVILSHGDVDHYNGLPGLLDRFSIGAVCVSPSMFDHDGAALQALHEAIDRAGVPIRQLAAGSRLPDSAAISLEILHPPRAGVPGRENANSLVLEVQYLGHRILLTGDLEPPGLDQVLDRPPSHCDILLVPHHGSTRSEPAALAAWSTPTWAVFSADGRWNLQPVEAIYAHTGGRPLCTAQTGAITFTLDGHGIDARTFVTP
jgi:competence protein ComEC